ncbi:hypothetical protein TVAG_445280 [Trichomonas vaginalis G3]|uniref:RRM domain-containing protein n=1 Tax=Trichomonas vaginalis (strain ATCC PRA-98 / G3) TaxID=412133 RepID=A2E4J4_TRIV3|nr:eukaryotic translation initiation factor 3 subunit G family [Trichomonas vaginalis G3]EAY12416.1 hypothetical protein TVAG_445280 [Trichomonas vaginalis G3]KAI5494179.1 eukaryotic translation initiation factor 3 subunit G family [Trichomonas vaginalis G3]|eukprot:XP_001324639.1 hypothetical protein [Trichomonas vaginalis G3]
MTTEQTPSKEQAAQTTEAEKTSGESKLKLNVYVTGFGMDGTEDDIKQIFSGFGQIESIKVVHSLKNPQIPPYAFIKFTNEKDAEASLAKNNCKYGTNVLKVELAKRDRGYTKEEARLMPFKGMPQRNRNDDRDMRDRRPDDRDRFARYDRYNEDPRYDYDRYNDRLRYDMPPRYPAYDRYNEPRYDYDDRAMMARPRYDQDPAYGYDDRRRPDMYYDRRDYIDYRPRY